MKKTILALLLLATACNDREAPETTEAIVALEGHNPVEFRTALLAIAEVEIHADGRQVPGTVERALADLAKGERLTLRVAVPADARELDVRIHFDPYGGFDAGRYAGHIDTRGAMLRFKAPARELAEGGQALIKLDLARSLAGAGPERIDLLPHYTLHY